MNEGEVDLSSQLRFSNPETASSFDEFLKNTTTCMHRHTCNPPGPAAAIHTHTCLHAHAQLLATGEDNQDIEEEPRKPRKPLGNREAVRKYREKKKAHAAYLEEEVRKLRAVNQQLLRRLQGQAALEAEVVRLRSLLFDVRAKIDAEIGAFPFQKQCSNGLICNDPTRCFSANAEAVCWEESSGPADIDCQMNQKENVSQDMDIPGAVNSMDVVTGLVSSASLVE